MSSNQSQPINISQALPGRQSAIPHSPYHAVNHHSIDNIPKNAEIAYFAMGCFWGVERLFWQQPGVYSTSAGYSGGITPNPTYEEVCTGLTGHTEIVRVVFDPQTISYADLLTLFWENHDPAQGMRQGVTLAPNTVRLSTPSLIRNYSKPQRRGTLINKRWQHRVIHAKSPQKSCHLKCFILRKITINSIFTKTQQAIVV